MKAMKKLEDQYPISTLCEALEVSSSGYYKARQSREGSRQRQNEELKVEIGRIHQQSRGTYGSPRVQIALRQEGRRHSRKRVARLMREEGLRGAGRRKQWVRTTDSKHGLGASPNLVKTLEIKEPNQVWVSDITYLRLALGGWIYLAAILDLYSRKIVGWAVSRSLEASLVIEALHQALKTRGWQPGLILHSDRGVQYASRALRRVLARHGLRQSMSAKGNCYDNATMESFFGTFKAEEADEFEDAYRARLAVFDYVETFYNTQRIHTSLGGKSPTAFEKEFSSGMGCSSGGHENDLEPEGPTDPAGSHDQKSHHPGYPLDGCSPAEPSSVLPERAQQADPCGLAQPEKTS